MWVISWCDLPDRTTQMPELSTRCRKQAAGAGREAPGWRHLRGCSYRYAAPKVPFREKGPFPLGQGVLPTQPQLSAFYFWKRFD